MKIEAKKYELFKCIQKYIKNTFKNLEGKSSEIVEVLNDYYKQINFNEVSFGKAMPQIEKYFEYEFTY